METNKALRVPKSHPTLVVELVKNRHKLCQSSSYDFHEPEKPFDLN
jgi:hypothetical protein